MLSKFTKFIPKIGKISSFNTLIPYRAFGMSPHMKDLADYNLKDVPVDK